MLGQGPGCPESVLSLETPAQGVDNGVPSCADVKCGFLPQQCSQFLPGVMEDLILKD